MFCFLVDKRSSADLGLTKHHLLDCFILTLCIYMFSTSQYPTHLQSYRHFALFLLQMIKERRALANNNGWPVYPRPEEIFALQQYYAHRPVAPFAGSELETSNVLRFADIAMADQRQVLIQNITHYTVMQQSQSMPTLGIDCPSDDETVFKCKSLMPIVLSYRFCIFIFAFYMLLRKYSMASGRDRKLGS
jgi:hypothetical protein